MATLTIDGVEWTTLGREGWGEAQLDAQPFRPAYIEALVDISARQDAALDVTSATVRLTTSTFTVEGGGMFRTGTLVSNGYEVFVRFEGSAVQPL